MKDFFDEQEWDGEIMAFLALCSPKDVGFMSTPADKRKTEDYVRLLAVSLVFGFRRVCLRILNEAEEKKVDIFPTLEREGKDYSTVCGWVESFIADVPDEKLRAMMREEWERKLSAADRKNFHINQLI